MVYITKESFFNQIGNFIKVLFKIFIAGVVSLVILSLFCLFYAYTGVHVKNETGATDYKWESNQFRSTMMEGFVFTKVDEEGFHNSVVRQANDMEILLMGSSHMEGFQVNTWETVGELLNKNYRTYNIGMSGHTFYTCVKNITPAVSTYSPTKFIIIELGNIIFDIEKIQLILDNKFPTIPSYDQGILYKLQKTVPVVKIIYKNIMDWKSFEESSLKDKVDVNQNFDEEYSLKLDFIIKKLCDTVDEADCQLIIFYHPQDMIDRNGNYYTDTNQEALKLFRETCENNNVIFVDMTEPFQKLYEEEHKLAHGFMNTGVGRGHLNKEGHRVIAETLLEVIKQEEVARCH